MLAHAARDGFSGTPQPAPAPINSHRLGVQESQPWLSEDGQTLYFSSTRDHVGQGPFIYTSTRLGEDRWSEPATVISGVQYGVGEPSLTADDQRLFYEQIFRNRQGVFATEFFYVERLEAKGNSQSR